MKRNFTKHSLKIEYLCIYFIFFKIHQKGQIETPSGPVLAHGPYVWQYSSTAYKTKN